MRYLIAATLVFFGWFVPAQEGDALSFSQSLEEGYAEVAPGIELFYKLYRASDEAPVIVALNGLTQDTDHWNRVLPELLKSDFTVLLFDAAFQGRSLVKYLERVDASSQLGTRPVLPPLMGFKTIWGDTEPFIPEITIADQSYYMALLLEQLAIDQKVNLFGLSYGGGFALQFAADYPEWVDNAILMAPYVSPLPSQDELIRYLQKQVKTLYPAFPYPDEELYDSLLRALVIGTYAYSEPTILRWGPFQSFAVSELVRGIRHMPSKDWVQQVPKGSLHMIIAGYDAYIPEDMMSEFWDSVPSENRGSLLRVEGVEHKLNESVGPFVASWAEKIINDHPEVKNGNLFSGIPEKGLAVNTSSDRQVLLTATPIREYLALRPRHPWAPNLPVDRIDRNPLKWWENWVSPFISKDYLQALQSFQKFLMGE